MRFLSILRTPKHQRFHIEPRYYDEVKEDLAQRTSRIKREIKLERKERLIGVASSSQISGSFSRRSRHQSTNAGFIRFFLITFLMGGFVGYLYLGNEALYGLLLFIPFYLLLRLRKLIRD